MDRTAPPRKRPAVRAPASDPRPHEPEAPRGVPDTLAAAARRLRRTADEAGARARALGRPVLAQIALPIPPLDLVTVFERARIAGADRFLWLRHGARFSLVGIGSAWEAVGRGPSRFTTVDAARRWAQDHAVGDFSVPAPWGTGPVSLYGFSFAAGGPAAPEWREFPDGWLMVPRVCAARAGDAWWIAASVMVAPDAAASEAAVEHTNGCLRALAEAFDDRPATVGATGPGATLDGAGEELEMIEERPAGAVWREMVGDAARAVRSERLTKVVLARSVRVRARRLDVARALRRLAAGNGESTVFAVAREATCFLGGTPEPLVRVRDGTLGTAVVAGSAPRGATPEEDRRLGERLLRSGKDLAEHATVVEAIHASLASVCATITMSPRPQLLSTNALHHLYTSVAGRLAGPRSILDLVERLHPTPAVGGVPRAAALRWIRDREGWDRGWYAGPVGWANGAGGGEAVVAIRSALVRDAEAVLFAGCGIMGDSDPASEYAESTWKLRPMLAALGGP